MTFSELHFLNHYKKYNAFHKDNTKYGVYCQKCHSFYDESYKIDENRFCPKCGTKLFLVITPENWS